MQKQYQAKLKIRWRRVAAILTAIAFILFSGGYYLGLHTPYEKREVKIDVHQYYWCTQVAVKDGDTLWGIVEERGFATERIPEIIDAIKRINRIPGNDHLTPGQVLLVPEQEI